MELESEGHYFRPEASSARSAPDVLSIRVWPIEQPSEPTGDINYRGYGQANGFYILRLVLLTDSLKTILFLSSNACADLPRY